MTCVVGNSQLGLLYLCTCMEGYSEHVYLPLVFHSFIDILYCTCLCPTDKRQRYPRSGPGTQLYTENGGQFTQGGPGRTGRRYSGDQKQRNRGAGQDKRHRGGRDGLKDTDNVSYFRERERGTEEKMKESGGERERLDLPS